VGAASSTRSTTPTTRRRWASSTSRLTFVDILKDNAETPGPWPRATPGGADKKSIVFTMQDTAKWSDGQAVTADDVAFTFNLEKQVPALDNYALWSGGILTSVTASGNQVTIELQLQRAVLLLQTSPTRPRFVPKHIWSAGDAAAHPDTWEDAQPIGSGPYTVSTCSGTNIEYKANKKLLDAQPAGDPDPGVPGPTWTTSRATTTCCPTRASGASSTSRT